jgi:hypothetical protein
MSVILAGNPNFYNDVPLVTDIGGKKVEAFVNHSVNQRRAFVQISPTSAISSNVIAGGDLQFKVENVLDRIMTCYLRLDYINSSGGNFICSAPVMHIGRNEIYANNGSNLLYQTTNPVATFMIDHVGMSRNEHEITASLRGTSSAYATGTITIPNGQSGSIYYSIAPNFWRALKLRPYCIDNNLLIRLRFQDSANIISSGSMTTTAAYLEFSGYYESSAQRKLMLQRAEIPKLLSYWAPQQNTETLTLAASTTYQVRLAGINGYVGQLYFAIRAIANATSPANQFSFVRPASFDILDPSSKSLTGFKTQTASDMIMLYSHQYDNLFINNTNACVYTFSQNSLQDVVRGTCNGFVEMRGSHYLQFTTDSTLVGGSYEVHVFGICNECLQIEKAELKTSRTN